MNYPRIVSMCLLMAIAAGTDTCARDSRPGLWLPNYQVVGKTLSVAIHLIEVRQSHTAIAPSAVEVLTDGGLYFSITAKYFGGNVSYKEVESILRVRHGSPLAENIINTSRWKFRTNDHTMLVLCLHKEGERVTITYAMDTEDS